MQETQTTYADQSQAAIVPGRHLTQDTDYRRAVLDTVKAAVVTLAIVVVVMVLLY